MRVVDLSFQGGYTEKTADKQQQTPQKNKKPNAVMAKKDTSLATTETATPTFRDEHLRYEMGKATVCVMRLPWDTDIDKRFLTKSLASARLFPDTSCLGFNNISVIPNALDAVLRNLHRDDHTKRKRYVLLGKNGSGPRFLDIGFGADGKPRIYGVQKLDKLNMVASGIIVLESGDSKK